MVTEPITYNHDPSLVEFLSLYSQAPPKLHGIDTMILLATEDKVRLARAKLHRSVGIHYSVFGTI